MLVKMLILEFCRFLELKTASIEEYLDTEKAVCDLISDLCKRVNQLLLLQSLYKSKTCESLLEPDDSPSIDLASSSSLYGKLKGYERKFSPFQIAHCPY